MTPPTRMRLLRPSLAVTLSLVPALTLAPTTALAFCRTTTCGSQPDPTQCPACGNAIAWESACIGLRVDARVLPDTLTAAAFHGHVADAARAWSSFLCPGTIRPPSFAMTVLEDLAFPVGYFEGAPNVNTITFRNHWGDDVFHAPDAAAITIVTFTSPSAHIRDADTELNLRSAANPRGFVFATDGRTNAADLHTIVTHELGHTQGLAHSSERSAVMWYSAGRGELRRVPTDDDRAGLCSIYPARIPEACIPDTGRLTFGGDGLSCTTSHGTRTSPECLLLALAAVARVAQSGRARRVTRTTRSG